MLGGKYMVKESQKEGLRKIKEDRNCRIEQNLPAAELKGIAKNLTIYLTAPYTYRIK